MILATLHIKVLVSNILYVVSLLGQKGSKFDLRMFQLGWLIVWESLPNTLPCFFHLEKLFFQAVSGAHCGGLLGSTLEEKKEKERNASLEMQKSTR